MSEVSPRLRQRLLALAADGHRYTDLEREELVDLVLADRHEWERPRGPVEYVVTEMVGPDRLRWASTDAGLTWMRQPGEHEPQPVGAVGAFTVVRVPAATSRP